MNNNVMIIRLLAVFGVCCSVSLAAEIDRSQLPIKTDTFKGKIDKVKIKLTN